MNDYLEASGKAFGITLGIFIIAFLIIIVMLHFRNLTAAMDISIKFENIHRRSSILGVVGLAIVIYLLFYREYVFRFKSNKKIIFSVYLINFLVMFIVGGFLILKIQ